MWRKGERKKKRERESYLATESQMFADACQWEHYIYQSEKAKWQFKMKPKQHGFKRWVVSKYITIMHIIYAFFYDDVMGFVFQLTTENALVVTVIT